MSYGECTHITRPIPGASGTSPVVPLFRLTALELNAILGKATWEWDDELGMHVPVCSRWKYDVRRGGIYHCGNGPLNESEYPEGTCSEGPHLERHERSI